MKFLKAETKALSAFFVTVTLLFCQFAFAADAPIHVNVDNFARAETAFQIDRVLKMFTSGKVNTWAHFRSPTPLDAQPVIRMNRDTLYSGAVVDISKGATLTIPETGDRYLSIQVTNEDHYINKVYHDAGTYKLTMKEFHTPYIILSARILVNSTDPEDIKEVNALQDKLTIKADSAKPYKHPNYDQVSYKNTHSALLELTRGLTDFKGAFGKKTDVNPVRHLIGQLQVGAACLNMRPSISMWSRTFRWAPISSPSRMHRWMPSGPSAFTTGMVIFRKMNTMLIA